MNRHPAHILLLKAARALELLIAAMILLVIVCGAVFLFRETGRTLLLSPEAVSYTHLGADQLPDDGDGHGPPLLHRA